MTTTNSSPDVSVSHVTKHEVNSDGETESRSAVRMKALFAGSDFVDKGFQSSDHLSGKDQHHSEEKLSQCFEAQAVLTDLSKGSDEIKAIGGNSSVQVKQATEIYGLDMDEYYPMTSLCKGHALVIVNSFKNSKDELRGTTKTTENLTTLFTGLGYQVHAFEDQTLEDINDTFTDFVNLDHSSMDSCIVAITTHGNVEDYLLATDTSPFHVDEIVSQFNHQRCPSLKGKPKLFFIEACRGEKVHEWTPPDFVDGDPSGTCEDMWIFSSTVPEYKSYIHEGDGGVFTSTVTKVFAEHAWNTPLSKLYEQVTKELRKIKIEDEAGFVYQVCALRKIEFYRDLYFNPGLHLETT